MNEEPKVVHISYFETSLYDRFRLKMQALVPDEIVSQFSGWAPEIHTLTFNGQESFVDTEPDLAITYVSHSTLGFTEWHEKRLAIEAFAEEHGFLNLISLANPEFVSQSLEPLPKGGNPEGLGVDLQGIIDGDPVLRYSWKPNNYIKALRQWAVQNHFGEIWGNSELESLFFGSYTPISKQGTVVVELQRPNTSSKELFEFLF